MMYIHGVLYVNPESILSTVLAFFVSLFLCMCLLLLTDKELSNLRYR
jgi:hypothetical protein